MKSVQGNNVTPVYCKCGNSISWAAALECLIINKTEYYVVVCSSCGMRGPVALTGRGAMINWNNYINEVKGVLK